MNEVNIRTCACAQYVHVTNSKLITKKRNNQLFQQTEIISTTRIRTKLIRQ